MTSHRVSGSRGAFWLNSLLRLALCLCLFAWAGCAFSDGTIRRVARTGLGGASAGMVDNQETLRQALRDVLLRDDTLEQIANRMVHGTIATLSDDEQKARVTALTNAMMDVLKSRGDQAVADLLARSSGQVEQVLHTIAADALGMVDAKAKQLLHKDLLEASEVVVRKNAELLSQAMAAQLRGTLGQSLQETGTLLARAVVNEAAQSLRNEQNQAAAREFLRAAMRDAVAGAGEGLRAELRSPPTEAALIAGLISLGVLLLAVGIGLWFFVHQYMMSSKALTIIAQKINEAKDASKPIKQAIHDKALSKNVEPWLSDFLQRRGL